MILWILFADGEPVSDSTWYYEKGISIALGKGYTIDGLPTAYYPVGYPMFLGALFKIFGISILVGRIANIFLYLGILFLSYYISKSIFKSELVGKITLLILSVYPNFIFYSSILVTELLFLFLFLLGTYLLLISKNKSWILIPAGIVLGLMCLVKPQGFVLPVILVVSLFNNNKRTFLYKLKKILLIYTFMVPILLPWVIRNYIVFDDFVFVSTNDGINLLMGNNPYATGQYHLDDKVISYLWDGDNVCDSPDSLVKYLPTTKYWSNYGFKSENIANKKLRKKAFDFILNNPFEEIGLLKWKMWFNYKKGNEGLGWAVGDATIISEFKKSVVLILGKIANYFYYAIMFFSFYYIIMSAYKILIKKQKQFFPATGLWIIIYFTILALIFFGGYRFNFPMMPWIVMYFGAAIEGFINLEQNRNQCN